MSEPSEAPSPAESLAAIKKDMARGEYLAACDAAEHALIAAPEDEALRHAAVLALARTGALDQARARFGRLGLDDVQSEEVLSLKGRLFKDLALAADEADRPDHLRQAIAAYNQAFDIDGGYFPAINVATLSALSGQSAVAMEWAERALALAEKRLATDGYYAEATIAEALLLLRRTTEAAEALQKAAVAAGDDFAARATTLRQLRLICAEQSMATDLLAPLKPPAVYHFCGHIIAPPGAPGRFPAEQADRVAQEIAAIFRDRPASRAVGSLAAGADILAAEAALATGAELDVVLPFALEEFIEISVSPAGEDWVRRMHVCLEAAREIHFVTEDAYLGDDALFGYASEYALGLASMRADWLSADVVQLAVWDGDAGAADAVAGTGHDVALGARLGVERRLVRTHSTAQAAAPGGAAQAQEPSGFARVNRCMLFGDLKGFSKLTDAQLPVYIEQVLGTCADVLNAHDQRLTFRNTWGDGLFLVFDDVAAAADCAFALQEAVAAIDRTEHGLPDDLGLRLGFHYGPVFEARDPVLDRQNCFGFHVSRAARVEPITPEGSVYVTEHTAAAIAVACPERYRTDYVGRMPLAKGYGSFPMHHLRPAR